MGVTQTQRFRLDIAYDGTGFAGWAKQPGLRTVQGVLEDAIATILGQQGEKILVAVAGRTDTGVHATGQVAHLDLDADRVERVRRGRATRDGLHPTGSALRRKVNGVLGQYPDVVITNAAPAAPGFDARFSAVWRRYEYRIADSLSFRSPLERAQTTWHPAPLDVARMDAAATSLTGLRDFATYCRPREGRTTIRTLQRFSWRRDAHGVLVADVRADAFCHSMVRALVGVCVAVGEGKLDVQDAERLRAELERSNEFAVMPARGLTLAEVGYPSDALLGQRAELTRQRRSLADGPDPFAEFDPDDEAG
ncbi:tRNA pseudouridine(38-40) synthase TruA [Mycetocola manganoxydans]|uniref:tRNA pseudouridine(38-40) synthase TruA n=1 Tax=Mycetocola manganoxydans TaxID=699879 RepID=UPI00198A0925|nr:tRNA pseudouridine synthase A [Mycetocola manganoxydans]